MDFHQHYNAKTQKLNGKDGKGILLSLNLVKKQENNNNNNDNIMYAKNYDENDINIIKNKIRKKIKNGK